MQVLWHGRSCIIATIVVAWTSKYVHLIAVCVAICVLPLQLPLPLPVPVPVPVQLPLPIPQRLPQRQPQRQPQRRPLPLPLLIRLLLLLLLQLRITVSFSFFSTRSCLTRAATLLNNFPPHISKVLNVASVTSTSILRRFHLYYYSD